MQQVVLAGRPEGLPKPEDFACRKCPIPARGDGQVLLRVDWLSIDPWLRPLLAGRHLRPPPEPGQCIPGTVLATVLETPPGGPAVGSRVVAEAGWAEHAVVPVQQLCPVEAGIDPPTLALGVLGMPGLAAWAGLRRIARPEPGQTVAVSAAAGTVGSVAGQLARLSGARAVAIVGDARKGELACRRFGYADFVVRGQPDFPHRLAAAAAPGIDVYFDNVGGDVLAAALACLGRGARVVLCGLIDQYNAAERPPGPNLGPVIAARATLTGLVVYDHLDARPEMLAELLPELAAGRLGWHEDLRQGLAAAPEAFVDLLAGRTMGKVLVAVSGTAS